MEVSLDDEDDTDDKENANDRGPGTEGRVVFSLKRYLPASMEPGPLVLTDKRRTIFLATDEGIAVLLPNSRSSNNAQEDYRLAALIPLPIMDRPRITSMTLGQDSYLYVTTESRLWRIKIRD